MNQRRTSDPADPIAARANRLAGRFAERAEAEGLVEITYATTDSPFGPLLMAATSDGLVRIALPGESFDPVLDDLAGRVSSRILELPARLDHVRRQLDSYFDGELTAFDLPIDWRLSHGFLLTARRVIASIPYGETLSYSQVAAEAGSPRAHRAAGTACSNNPLPIVVPCHRVLATGGGLGGYGGGLPMKRALLDLEQGRAPLRAP